jgi:hypothetical protein
VAQDTRQRKYHLPFDDVQIGMTDAAGGYVHQHLAGFGLGGRDIFEPELTADFCQDNRLHGYDSSPSHGPSN